ncbi:unnamed protein product [Ranitomeya imitator]|uniref:ribonuclease H n=1 Tax=Ranitomeya imitator TaxID=111125 RepID=A0ABN9KQJ7_9NEOB|nr:unnamed protein product [Ranitomeya imitator]
MESRRSVIASLEKREFLASIDIQDAYLHIPIFPLHQRFLRFAVNNLHFQFTALPFGLASAPRVFTKVMSTVVSILHSLGIVVLPYLDDLLIKGPTFQSCKENVDITLDTLSRLGCVSLLAAEAYTHSPVSPNERLGEKDFTGLIAEETSSRLAEQEEDPEKFREGLVKFESRFNFPEAEKLVTFYSCCCWKGRVPRQGWLYLSINHLCFYSFFLGKELKLVIPWVEVQKLERASNVLMVDIIMVYTRGKEREFSMFLDINEVFRIMEQLADVTVRRLLDNEVFELDQNLQQPTQISKSAVLCTPPVLAVSVGQPESRAVTSPLCFPAAVLTQTVQEECRAQRWRTEGSSYPMFTLVTGIVGRWRAVCVTALQRPNSDAAAIRIVVGIAAASLNVKGP